MDPASNNPGFKLCKIGYSLKDVTVIQAPIGKYLHRADVNPFTNICGRDGVYPIFVSPMASVTDEKNYKVWIDNKLTPVIPRSVKQNIDFKSRMKLAEETFVSISLQEAEEELLKMEVKPDQKKIYICIDIANGNLQNLYHACKKLKKLFKDKICIMTGNVANPKTYKYYADYGIDWMRVGIGLGSRCITACNTSIYYPPATLLDELHREKLLYAKENNGNAPTKIILDGGITNFDEIMKALALGADAVMSGYLFAIAEEACGEIGYAKNITEYGKGNYLEKEEYNKLGNDEKKEMNKFRDYYGMSTKKAQSIVNGRATKTSEGISKPVMIEYPVAKWVDNMQSYMRSAMSYTNSGNLDEFRENTQLIILGGSGDFCYRK
jgi:IMP dehydrogenase/GMP reductase